MKNNMYILKLIWKICPGRVIAEFFINIIGYASWVFYSIYFTRYLLSAMEKGESFGKIMGFLILSTVFFGAMAAFEIWFYKEYIHLTDALIYEKVNGMLFSKASNVELECYEDTEFYNKYTLAIRETDHRISSILSNLPLIITALVSSIVVVWNMYRIDTFVIIFILAPLLGNFYFGKKVNKVVHARDKACVPYRRRMDYVNRVVYLSDYAKEMRMTNIFNVLRRMYNAGYSGLYEVIKKYQWKAVSLGFCQNLFTFFIIFQGVMIYSLYRTMVSKTITISEFAVLSNAMVAGAWMLIHLSGAVVEMYQNSLYIQNLKEFIEYQPKMPEDSDGINPEEFQSLEVLNVSFTYRGQDKPTLKDISFTVKKGEKIAFVGHNGAGKTTLIKLLMRLYDVEEGEIRYNGNDIKDYNLKEYRKLFSTAFQDYQLFSMSVAENILMHEPRNEEDYKTVEAALKMCDIYDKVMSLPKGMDTVLTREFTDDGAVLSGGEAQKIAVARAFAKDYKIAIFDEPSSALDPIAEYRLYESMMKNSEGRTVFFISHRLSTATLADRVYLFENGQIVEAGTHNELFNKGGKYADMFAKQAQSYLEEVSVCGNVRDYGKEED